MAEFMAVWIVLVIVLMIVGLTVQIVRFVPWMRKTLRQKLAPNVVVFSWRTEDGQLRWALSRPGEPSIDITDRPEELKRWVKKGAILIPPRA